jgi:dTDP-4-amino-4,6-dideoxygalactose transaminase
MHDCGANWRYFTADNESIPSFPGFNSRMGELTAALLLVQLEKRESILNRMRKSAGRLNAVIAGFDGIVPRRLNEREGDVGICCMFTARDKNTAEIIAKALQAEGVDGGTMGDNYSIPDWHIYRNWGYMLDRRGNNDSGFPFTLSDRNYTRDMCPKTLDYLGRVVHMNVSPLLSDEDVDEISYALKKVLGSLL